MTPQFILRAGLQDYLSKFRSPDGTYKSESGLTPAPAWDTLESHRRTAESLIDNLNYANGYAEAGYTEPKHGILFADWNHVSKRTLALLERAGYECEWEDEWSTCEHCNKAVRTSPDSYGWSPSYVILNECEIVCRTCLLEDENWVREYLEGLENRTRSAVSIDINPAKFGYVRLKDGFESGFHPGQNDDPKSITAKLRTAGETRPLLFKIDDSGQFDIGFSVWARLTEAEETESV